MVRKDYKTPSPRPHAPLTSPQTASEGLVRPLGDTLTGQNVLGMEDRARAERLPEGFETVEKTGYRGVGRAEEGSP